MAPTRGRKQARPRRNIGKTSSSESSRLPSASRGPLTSTPDINNNNNTNFTGFKGDSSISPINGDQLSNSEENETQNNNVNDESEQQQQEEKPVEREIRELQSTTNNLLKLSPFSRIVQELIAKVRPGKNFRIQSEAIQALREASEAHLITLFEASYLITSHSKRVTLDIDDLQLARRILGYNL